MPSSVFNLASGCETNRRNYIMASIPFDFLDLNIVRCDWSPTVRAQGPVQLSPSCGVIVIDI